MSAADTALVALADHCIDCPGCTPDVDRPEEPRPTCPEGMHLYRAWRQACREDTPLDTLNSRSRPAARRPGR